MMDSNTPSQPSISGWDSVTVMHSLIAGAMDCGCVAGGQAGKCGSDAALSRPMIHTMRCNHFHLDTQRGFQQGASDVFV